MTTSMGGSQLSQLKAALHTSGLSSAAQRQQQQQRGKKKQAGGPQRKSGGFVDEDARKAKLEVSRAAILSAESRVVLIQNFSPPSCTIFYMDADTSSRPSASR